MRANFWWFQLDPDASLDICRDAVLDATYNLDSSLENIDAAVPGPGNYLISSLVDDLELRVMRSSFRSLAVKCSKFNT